jgi:hypothetical protein
VLGDRPPSPPHVADKTIFVPCRKFGKQIQKRQLEVPEYAASFVNYKALKKVCLPIARDLAMPLQMPVFPASYLKSHTLPILVSNESCFCQIVSDFPITFVSPFIAFEASLSELTLRLL